jgi:hypothetical protein
VNARLRCAPVGNATGDRDVATDPRLPILVRGDRSCGVDIAIGGIVRVAVPKELPGRLSLRGRIARRGAERVAWVGKERESAARRHAVLTRDHADKRPVLRLDLDDIAIPETGRARPHRIHFEQCSGKVVRVALVDVVVANVRIHRIPCFVHSAEDEDSPGAPGRPAIDSPQRTASAGARGTFRPTRPTHRSIPGAGILSFPAPEADRRSRGSPRLAALAAPGSPGVPATNRSGCSYSRPRALQKSPPPTTTTEPRRDVCHRNLRQRTRPAFAPRG